MPSTAPPEDDKITFDYLLAKVVENTAALTNKTTLEGTLTSEEAYPYPPEPTYKVSLEGDENERVAVVRQ